MIEIQVPPEMVWEMLAWDRLREWDEATQKHTKSIEYTSQVRTPNDKYQVGASAHMSIKGEGEVEVKITDSIENEKMTFRSRGGRTCTTMTFLMEAAGEGTRFTYVYDYKMPWGVLGKFLDRLFLQRMGEKEIETFLKGIEGIGVIGKAIGYHGVSLLFPLLYSL